MQGDNDKKSQKKRATYIKLSKCAPHIAKYVLKVARLKENEISNWIQIVEDRIGNEISTEMRKIKKKNESIYR